MNSNKKINHWIKLQKKNNKIKIKLKKINQLNKWIYNNKDLHHTSGKFFKIVGISVNSNFGKKKWDQPIIIQNENGILGIIRKKFNNQYKYLLQAKVEPGNINKLQLSPTVQATKSNYSRVHGGKKTKFLNFFLNKKNLIKSKQSEQGFRYLYKFNTNIIVNTKKITNIPNNFYWFSKNDLNYFIKKNNIINMDTISVFSCFISKNKENYCLNSNNQISKWFNINSKKFFIKRKIVDLKCLKDWSIKNNKIVHKKNKHFSIIGVKVKTNSREVLSWEQPIIRGKKLAFAGFLVKKFNKTYHYLSRFVLKPGLKNPNFTCTVNTSDINNFVKNINISNIQKMYLKNYFFNKIHLKNKIFDNVQSDEGGRFYHSKIRNMIIEIKNDKIIQNNNFIWISHNQMIDLIKKQKFDIEARLLFASFNFHKII